MCTVLAICAIEGVAQDTQVASDLLVGLRAYYLQDYVSAMRELYPLAHQGNPEAQLHVGRMLLFGLGGTKDEKRGFDFLLLAAQQDNIAAQVLIGVAYEKGTGVDKNIPMAFKWSCLAAARGDPAGQFNCAEFYRFGHETKQNFAKAAELYRNAAEKGITRAKFRIAHLYLSGRGVQKNAAEAVKWFRSAAIAGDLESAHNLGALLLRGDGVTRDPKQAVDWLRRAAEGGVVASATALAQVLSGAMPPVGLPAPTSPPWVKRCLFRFVRHRDGPRRSTQMGFVCSESGFGARTKLFGCHVSSWAGRSAGLCRRDSLVSKGSRTRRPCRAIESGVHVRGRARRTARRRHGIQALQLFSNSGIRWRTG